MFSLRTIIIQIYSSIVRRSTRIQSNNARSIHNVQYALLPLSCLWENRTCVVVEHLYGETDDDGQNIIGTKWRSHSRPEHQLWPTMITYNEKFIQTNAIELDYHRV